MFINFEFLKYITFPNIYLNCLKYIIFYHNLYNIFFPSLANSVAKFVLLSVNGSISKRKP